MKYIVLTGTFKYPRSSIVYTLKHTPGYTYQSKPNQLTRVIVQGNSAYAKRERTNKTKYARKHHIPIWTERKLFLELAKLGTKKKKAAKKTDLKRYDVDYYSHNAKKPAKSYSFDVSVWKLTKSTNRYAKKTSLKDVKSTSVGMAAKRVARAFAKANHSLSYYINYVITVKPKGSSSSVVGYYFYQRKGNDEVLTKRAATITSPSSGKKELHMYDSHGKLFMQYYSLYIYIYISVIKSNFKGFFMFKSMRLVE